MSIHIVGIPILRVDVCSESEATFTCTVNESIALHWSINFLSGNDIDRVTYLSTYPTGLVYLVANFEGTQSSFEYHFNLTSKSPLTSTMITDTPTDLSGATVSCSSGVQLQASTDVATLGLHGKLNCNIALTTIIMVHSHCFDHDI